MQRYANVRADMQLQQAMEKNRFEKTFQTMSTVPASETQQMMMRSEMFIKTRGMPKIVEQEISNEIDI